MLDMINVLKQLNVYQIAIVLTALNTHGKSMRYPKNYPDTSSWSDPMLSLLSLMTTEETGCYMCQDCETGKTCQLV